MLIIPGYISRSMIPLSDAVAVVQNLTINSTSQQSELIKNGAVETSNSTSGHINFRVAIYCNQAAFDNGAEPVEYYRETSGIDYFNLAIDSDKTGREQAYDYLLERDTFNESVIAENISY